MTRRPCLSLVLAVSIGFGAPIAFAQEGGGVDSPTEPAPAASDVVEGEAVGVEEDDLEETERESRVLDGRNFYVAVVPGYGWATADLGSLDLDPYRFGVGARLAWTFNNGFYLGAAYNWYMGSEVKEDFYGFEVISESSAWNVSLDIGYDLWIGPLITRYVLSAGIIHMDLDRGQGNRPKDTIQLSPLFGVFYPIDWFVVGVEAYFSFIPTGDVPSAIALNIPIGVRF